jgi:hypothetical protein
MNRIADNVSDIAKRLAEIRKDEDPNRYHWENASGPDLDVAAERCGLTRHAYESDYALRVRIQASQ